MPVNSFDLARNVVNPNRSRDYVCMKLNAY